MVMNMHGNGRRSVLPLTAMMLLPAALSATPAPQARIDVAALPRVGTVSDRFQSYTIEMLEVIGGDFWKPYEADGAWSPAGKGRSAMYAYRPPIDLSNMRLRRLAKALGPAYLRVSGTWANSVHFPGTGPVPDGFKGALSAAQWRGVVAFSRAVDAPIVTSFAISPGTRDARGVWTVDQARALLRYTRRTGGRIAAVEFMNEPSMAGIGGAPKGYDAAGYARDAAIFARYLRAEAPGTILLGPGSATETPRPWGIPATLPGSIATEAMLTAAPLDVDAFSYHHYGAASQRCAAIHMPQTTLQDALSEEWLGRTSETLRFYESLRDRYLPGKPMWMTEGADAACGGNPWSGSFVDSFRYLDQLGRLARAGVQVVFHNTLAGSNYGLLDPATLAPKPTYWSALLWHRLMGRTVLDSGVPVREGLHAYAHCQRGARGGVAMLLLNNHPSRATELNLPGPVDIYALTQGAGSPFAMALNGRVMGLTSGDDLPAMSGQRQQSGRITLPPRTISFVTMPGAGNPACRTDPRASEQR